MGYCFGQPPSDINGAGPTVGPPESNRSGFGCSRIGLGEGVGSGVAGGGVGDGLAVAVAVAVGEVPAVGEAVPADEPAALLFQVFWSVVRIHPISLAHLRR